MSDGDIIRLHCRSLEDMLQFSLQHRAQLTWITEYTSVRDLDLSLEDYFTEDGKGGQWKKIWPGQNLRQRILFRMSGSISGDLRTVTPMEECLNPSTVTAGEIILLLWRQMKKGVIFVFGNIGREYGRLQLSFRPEGLNV